MEWYEWVFDGVGTAIIGLISGVVSYKAAVKKMSIQTQIAKEEATQKQEIVIDNSECTDKRDVQSSIKQMQKAGNKAEQVQIGRFMNGKQADTESRK